MKSWLGNCCAVGSASPLVYLDLCKLSPFCLQNRPPFLKEPKYYCSLTSAHLFCSSLIKTQLLKIIFLKQHQVLNSYFVPLTLISSSLQVFPALLMCRKASRVWLVSSLEVDRVSLWRGIPSHNFGKWRLKLWKIFCEWNLARPECTNSQLNPTRLMYTQWEPHSESIMLRIWRVVFHKPLVLLLTGLSLFTAWPIKVSRSRMHRPFAN